MMAVAIVAVAMAVVAVAVTVAIVVTMTIAVGSTIPIQICGSVRIEFVSAVIVGHNGRGPLQDHLGIKLVVIEHPLPFHVFAVSIPVAAVTAFRQTVAIAAGAGWFGGAGKFQAVAIEFQAAIMTVSIAIAVVSGNCFFSLCRSFSFGGLGFIRTAILTKSPREQTAADN